MKIILILSSCLLISAFALSQKPIITTQYTADPSAHVFNSKIYLYPSHDRDDSKTFDMIDYHVYSSEDLINWVDHGIALHLDSISWATEKAWAPDCAFKNGKYYFYFPTDRSYIGVAVSNSPSGPFKDALGKPLITKDSPGVVNTRDFIDPSIFIDDDGIPYLFFGQLDLNVVKLNNDMVSYDTPVIQIEGTKNFFEAIWVHKYNNTYYLSYSTWGEKGITEPQIAYATSENIFGPYEYKGIILDEVNSGTNHHSIVEFKGKWYIFYHNSNLFLERKEKGIETEDNAKSYRRSVCMTPLYYNEDGTIQKIDPTK
ncbi:MAG: family 43 glycosylhydrolase [Marinilabiliaceae bacterium]|nr:family 43 glycosylhydrolase [Marinilabiliaceae bacterium]